ncbi:MAG: hypothetical protein Q4D37_05890 [Oscillospiraceae bacterium]|nr:hypothetical protein [Oscillospiraceae bacterium]
MMVSILTPQATMVKRIPLGEGCRGQRSKSAGQFGQVFQKKFEQEFP